MKSTALQYETTAVVFSNNCYTSESDLATTFRSEIEWLVVAYKKNKVSICQRKDIRLLKNGARAGKKSLQQRYSPEAA